MKTSHISLILISAILFGCASPSPKVSLPAKNDARTAFFTPETLVRPDQFQLSYEVDFPFTPIAFASLEAQKAIDLFSPPSPLKMVGTPFVVRESEGDRLITLPWEIVVTPPDKSRREMSLIDPTPLR